MSKIFNFIKRNAFYFIIGLSTLIIGLSIALVAIFGLEKTTVIDDGTADVSPAPTTTIPDEPTEDVVKQVVFVMPTNGAVVKSYTDTVVFNSTLNRYSKHTAIDFFGEEGANVYAVYDGVVDSVEYSILTGVTVTLDHGNGLKTVYNSLLNEDLIEQGATVKQGDVIGKISVSNRQEAKDGPHLHFEVMENGEIINPEKYLTLDEK